jgi:hypothetical protein
VTSGGPLCEAPLEDRSKLRRDAAIDARPIEDDPENELVHGIGAERWTAGDDLVQQDAERPNVGAAVDVMR